MVLLLSVTTHPFSPLLETYSKWIWSKACKTACQTLKQQLSPKSNLLITIQVCHSSECDAMPYRVEAVKSHVMPNGDENPIAFGSQTLSKAERKKPCTSRKRSLGDCFQHKKLYEFIYCQRLILVNDHKSLTTIFSPKASLPALSPTRLQR